MSVVKHKSRIKQIQKSGIRNTITYSGTYDEMRELQEMNPYGFINEEIGKVTSSRIYQLGGMFWECELVSELNESGAASAPDTSFGRKSAQLNGTLMQVPLPAHPDYLASWDHYLFAAPGVKEVPSFWDKTQFAILDDNDAQKYAWGKSPADAPSTNGKRWRALKSPLFPGVTSYDVGTYTLTISARYGSFREGAQMVNQMLNRVKSDPGIDTGISGGDWKCESCSVQWHESYYLGTLVWTRSGDSSGWNKTLYRGAR